MNGDRTLPVWQQRGQPALGAHFIRRGPQRRAPAGGLVCRHAGYVTFDALGERRSDPALRVEEPDQDLGILRASTS